MPEFLGYDLPSARRVDARRAGVSVEMLLELPFDPLSPYARMRPPSAGASPVPDSALLPDALDVMDYRPGGDEAKVVHAFASPSFFSGSLDRKSTRLNSS